MVTQAQAILNEHMEENEFQQQLRDTALLYNWLYYHTHDSRRCDLGFLDTVLLKSNRLIFAELKVKHNTMSSSQKTWFNTLSTCEGIEVYLWYPKDWDTIVSILSK